jgi:tryptophan 2,3-dioxygenase
VRAALGAGPKDAADAARAAVEAIRAEASPALRRAVEITLLPMTTLHDERMFIRSIQLFERLFARVARAMGLAVAAVRAGRPLEAADFLESAATRLPGATAPLYRILTTMPPEAFAVIRDHTHGASAIQSRPYQLVETVSAKREAGAHSPEKGPLFTLDATLQEAFLAHAGGWATEDARRLEAAMRKLDAGWCGMKRTHWGVTMKIIGRVPGTGGTTGADYLKAAAQVPLFPLLATG